MNGRLTFLAFLVFALGFAASGADAAVRKGPYLFYDGTNIDMTVLWQVDSLHTQLTPMPISASTGEKPQSKVWSHDGLWWAVLPNASGTYLWRLDGTAWTSVLLLSDDTDTRADVKVVGEVVHILLYRGVESWLVSVEYVPGLQTYQAWTIRSYNSPISLESGGETATIDIDSTGRMWVAFDTSFEIRVRYSDSPYDDWTAIPITLASGVNADDICVVTALPNGTIGVLWSNQNTRRFGFRVHTDGTDPTIWSVDEVPASQSAKDDVGLGMADDHLNVAVASDSTLYAAVKTSYDTGGYPKIALLVRRPDGLWDNLYEVDTAGTRPIAILNEAEGTISVIYTASESGSDIVFKQSPTAALIDFSAPASTLMSGQYNNVSSTKDNYTDELVVICSDSSNAYGVPIINEIGNCTIKWGLDTSYSLGSDVTTEYGNDHQHEYIISGLTPGNKYYYKVIGVGSGSFTTAPAVNADNVKFLVFGDTRTDHGGVPYDYNNVCGAMNTFLAANPDYQTLVLHTGDWINSDTETDWSTMFFNRSLSNALQLHANIPINGCIGNHEGGGTNYLKYYPYPYFSPFYWSFDYGPVHVVVVDQYTGYTEGTDQYNWCLDDLDTTDKQWKFIVFHEPAWSADGGHGCNTTAQGFINSLVADGAQFDIVFSGHNHYYARCDVDGIQHITSGGGGAPLRDVGGTPSYVVYAEKTLEFCEINIQGSTLYFRALRPDLSEIDSFSISYDSEPPSITCITQNTDGTTGEIVTIEATIADNDDVASAMVYYIPIDGTETTVPMMEGTDDAWSADVPIASDKVGTVTYYITAEDAAGNPAREPADTGTYNITVTDNDDPTITGSTGDATANTGETVLISATITDNIDVLNATVHYTPIGIGETTSSMNEGADNVWSVSILAGSQEGTIPYYITADDAVPNTATEPSAGSYTITVTLPDTESPLITGATGTTSGTTGEPVTISATITDNVAVTSATVYYTPIGASETTVPMMVVSGNVWSAEVPVASDKVGTIPYYITAQDEAANSAKDPSSGTYDITVTDNDAPSAVTNLAATAVAGGAIELAWSAATDNIAVVSYNIYRDTTEITDISSKFPIDNVTDTSYTDSTAADGTTYFYAVAALDAAGNKAAASNSPSATADSSGPVISVVASSNVTTSSATITWTTDEASDSVVVYGTVTPPGSQQSDATTVTAHSVPLTGLSPATNYYYEVKSTDAVGNTSTDNNGGVYYEFTTETLPNTLFTDGFESGNFTAGGWNTSSNTSVKEPASYTGLYGAQFKDGATITKAISTVGYTAIRIKYARKTGRMDSSEQMIVQYSADGGVNWTDIESTSDTTWAVKDMPCGSDADGNANFQIRFSTTANKTNEYGYVDDVEIIGTPAGPVDNPPSVTITNPTDGAILSDTVTVQIDATDVEDAAGTLTVEWNVDGDTWAAATYNSSSGYYEASWDTIATDEGNHTVNARATDSASNTASTSVGVTVDNVDDAPTVSIVNPTEGATVSGNVIVSADATDDRGMTQVEFFVDGESIGVDSDGSDGWSANWDTTGAADGSHTVSAVATDTATQTASNSISVTVNNSGPSTVHVQSIAMSLEQAGRKYYATATVQLNPSLEGATVVGDWYFKGTLRASGATGVTNADRIAVLTSFTTPAKSGDTFMFMVTDVVFSGYIYEPGQGVTSGSITVP